MGTSSYWEELTSGRVPSFLEGSVQSHEAQSLCRKWPKLHWPIREVEFTHWRKGRTLEGPNASVVKLHKKKVSLLPRGHDYRLGICHTIWSKFCGQRHTPNEGVVAEKGIIIILSRKFIQQQKLDIGDIIIFSRFFILYFCGCSSSIRYFWYHL